MRAKRKRVSFRVQNKKKQIVKQKRSLAAGGAAGCGVLIFIAILSVSTLGAWVNAIDKALPDPNLLIEWQPEQSTVILDRNGKHLYTIYKDENRRFAPIDEIPQHTKWAILASEDIEFYTHKGLDFSGMFRAAYVNIKSEETMQGASTITQQLVKNTLMYSLYKDEAFEKTYLRKLRESILALRVEQKLSKDEILQMYINEFACGDVYYGIEACANAYFGKSASDLTLAESAMIAGIISSPSTYSPLFGSQPEQAQAKQERVLSLMYKHKDRTGVTKEDFDAAKEEELVYKTQKTDLKAPHFVFYIRDELVQKYGTDVVEKGGLTVITTLDLDVQQILEEEIRNGVKQYGHRFGVQNGAGLVVDPQTNQILAMVGSIDYNNRKDPRIDGNVNVTTSLRQMGSSVKPYTYLAAFERGFGPWLSTPDVSTHNFGSYRPVNWDRRYYGPMVARQALAQSRNIPAVYTVRLIGVETFIDTAEKMGITTLKDRSRFGPSITLGAAEMKLTEHAQGFSVFATGGVKRDITGIIKITDRNNIILEEYKQTKGTRVFDEKSIYMINWILCDLGWFGDQPFSSSYYTINGRRAICGKTGTTDGPRDLVAIQYHKNLLVAIWAGNNNNIPTPGAWSTTVPLPISHKIMNRLANRYPSELYSAPAGIYNTTVCNTTGGIPTGGGKCAMVRSIYAVGNPPPYTYIKPEPKEEEPPEE